MHSNRFIGGLAIAWGLLVWINWFNANPLSVNQLSQALVVWGGIRPDMRALTAFLSHLKLLGLMTLLVVSAFGLGRPVTVFLGLRQPGPMVLMAIALGAGVLSLIVLGFGFNGLLFRLPCWAVVLSGLALVIFRRWRLRGGIARVKSRFTELDMSLLFPGLLIVFSLGLAIVGALAPEASFDGQAHHLAHPQLYAAHHKVYSTGYHFLSNFPALLEMQYLLAMMLSGEARLAKLVHFSWGILVACTVLVWARERLGIFWALTAAAGFLLLPYVHLVLMWAYVDFGAAGYLTLALLASQSRWGRPALLGVLCGLCAGTKVTGVFAPVLVVVALVARGEKRWPSLAGFALVFLLVVSPWGLKNFVFTGNPVAPFLSDIFPTLNWGPENAARYEQELSSYEEGHSSLRGWGEIVARPWDMSIHNTGVLDRMAGMSAWFIWALPLLVFLRAPGARGPAWFALIYFILWQFIPRQVRYMLPAWPVATIACVCVVRELSRRGGIGMLAVWGAGAVLVLHLVFAVQRQHAVIHPIRVVFGMESSDEYLGRGMPGKAHSIRARAWLREQGGDSRTLVLNQYGLGLFWGSRAIVQSFFDTPLFELYAKQEKTSEGIAKRFKQAGIDLTLYDQEGGFYMQRSYSMFHFDTDSAGRWLEFWVRQARLVRREAGQYMFHRITASSGSASSEEKRSVWPGLDEQWLSDLDDEYISANQRGDPAAALLNTVAGYDRIARETGSPTAYERLGVGLLGMGREEQARAALVEGERRGRRSAKLCDALGVIHLRARAYGKAAERFGLALDYDPYWERAYLGLAHALVGQGRRGAATAVLTKGIEAVPGSVKLRKLLTRYSDASVNIGRP